MRTSLRPRLSINESLVCRADGAAGLRRKGRPLEESAHLDPRGQLVTSFQAPIRALDVRRLPDLFRPLRRHATELPRDTQLLAPKDRVTHVCSKGDPGLPAPRAPRIDSVQRDDYVATQGIWMREDAPEQVCVEVSGSNLEERVRPGIRELKGEELHPKFSQSSLDPNAV